MSGFLKNIIFFFVLISFNLIKAQDQKDVVVTLIRNTESSLSNDGELLYSQKRIQNIYRNDNYLKCIKKASKKITNNNKDKVAYYYLALSTFKLYQEKLNPLLFDRTLKFLKASQFNLDPTIRELQLNDKDLLEMIHQEALSLCENEAVINRNKTKRRLQYVAELYQDSTDLFKQLIGLKNKESLEISTANKYDDLEELLTVSDLVIHQLESQLINNNQQTLSEFLTNQLGLEVDIHQAKIMDISATQYGVCEYEGKDHNKEVIKYFKETGHNYINKDETSWCSAYMSWCAKKAGLYYSKSLLARSWLKMGAKVTFPQPGDIVVFWREKVNSWEGHVSIFLYEDEKTNQIFCLGGNQDGKVCVAPYPSNNVLGYRRIKPII